jgi:SAM-dependent methyltransferase
MMADELIVDETLIAELWDANAETWAAGLEKGEDVFRSLISMPAFLELLAPRPAMRVLDVGCGEGESTRALSRAGASAIGVDLSGGMLKLAVDRERFEPLGVRYLRGSATSLPVAGAVVDAVSFFMSLMDMPDISLAMAEARRVLVPGGIVAFAVLHPCFPTQGFREVSDANGDFELRMTIRDYFDTAHRIDRAGFGPLVRGRDRPMPFSIARFPRTIASYVNAVASARLRVEEIVEPRPDAATCEQHEWLWPWSRHASAFFMLRACTDECTR